MPFSRRKMYTLQPQRGGGGPGTSSSSLASRSRFKVMKKLGRHSRRRRSARYTRHRPLVSTESMVLHELIPALPMPSEPELNAKFALMVDELGLNREIMLRLSSEKKWQLYLSKQKDQQTSLRTDHPQPEFYVDEFVHLNSMVMNATLEQADFEGNLKVVKDLKTALRTQPLSFVLNFIELNGLEHLFDFLRRMNNDIRQSQLHYIIMGCIKALMNNPNGRAHVLAHPTGITVIAQSLKTTNLKTKILTLEILGALCLVPGGHKKVLTAVVHFQQFACERTRFQTLLMDLSKSLDDENDASSLQIAILSFFNALINYKTGEESLEFRLHVRHELLMLGIQPIINRLHSLNIAQLSKHLEIFEFIRMEDEREFAMRLQLMETVDYTNPSKMAEILQRKTVYTAAYPHYISILYHCLLIPIDDTHYDKYWRLIDRMVQQAVIQQDHGVDPDVSPLPINVQKLVLLLLREDEQRSLIRQMEDMKKAQEHMAGRLKRMEWDCETKTMERDGLRATVDKMKVQLEQQQQETFKAEEEKRKAERSLVQVSQNVEELKARCEQLEGRLKEKNVDISDLPPVVIPVVPHPPPPPPPPMGVPPPPPAPGLISAGYATIRRRKKNIPKPKNPLKSLNWVKLHDAEIQGTVWDKLDDTKVFGVLNLEELEKSFHQKPTRAESIPYLTLPRREQPKEISFIDSNRAQNCTILLSRLKLSDQQICKAVLSMDEDMRLGKDMVEQLLKFVPKKAEVEKLQLNLAEAEKFSRADKFMMRMSQVPRYQERLRALYFKKTFDDRMGEVCPQIQDILAACHELMLSGKLQKVLEVVLAFGNFMNRGSRGNASGFKLSSLNKIVDTKSSTDTNMNLMHYLLQTLETKFPDMLSVELELPHIRNAAKVELIELEKEFRSLQTELQDLKDELDFHRKYPSGDPDDRFVPAVEDFAIHAAIKVRETDMLLKEMKEQFQKALHFFGEDPTTTTTDKFMGIFLTFFKSFEEAHVHIIAQRKRKAEEEKRKKHEEQRKTETLRRREQREKQTLSRLLVDSEVPIGEGNLDELIDKLKSGELWHVMGQAKRRSRRVSNGLTLEKTLLAMGLDLNRDRLTDSPAPVESQ